MGQGELSSATKMEDANLLLPQEGLLLKVPDLTK